MITDWRGLLGLAGPLDSPKQQAPGSEEISCLKHTKLSALKEPNVGLVSTYMCAHGQAHHHAQTCTGNLRKCFDY